MIRYFKYALPAFCGGLALLLLAEWLIPGPAAPAADRPGLVTAAASDPSEDSDIAQWGNTSLARPLFNADRRPVAQMAASTDNTPPHLTAIIVIGGLYHAIFAATGEKPQVAATGAEIGQYQLERIAADHVELLGPGGAITLRLQFNPGDAAPAPAPVTVQAAPQPKQSGPVTGPVFDVGDSN